MKVQYTFENTWTGNQFTEEVDIPVSANQSADQNAEYAINRAIDAAWARHPNLDTQKWALVDYEIKAGGNA